MRRLSKLATWLVLTIGFAIAGAWWAARPPEPDAFYAPPATAPPQAGVLLRQEPFDRDVPAEARAWRILYTTTRADQLPAVASAIVMISRNAPAGPRPVVAWAHGTTGVARGCAPSLLKHPFANVPALSALLERGWIFVGTDYVGLGTASPHPYLIGEGEARSVLDSVRATRAMKGLQAENRVVIWGHSQGGNAALWSGILAPTYAPDIALAGVAAAAPASDLRALVDAAQGTPVGRILSSFILSAYADSYSDVTWADSASIWRRPLIADIAGRCMAGPGTLFSVAESVVLTGAFFRISPMEGELGQRLAQNTPDRAITSPVLIAQGLSDDLVLPSIQRRFVERRCAAGQLLDARYYAEMDHLSIVATNSPLGPELVRWSEERIAGVPVREKGCAQSLP
jgi:alpha-beta hydrolase superfamily lysophospholipase